MHLLFRGLFVLAFGLAGCAQLEQGGAMLSAPAPQQYPADAGATAGPAAASIGWHDYYVDPR
ncbi:MAG: hypothetical protein M3Y65_05085, partial [Pseudomonadota bacterium]|nr:hypothetical protein [Pseudomonadota bacterium]